MTPFRVAITTTILILWCATRGVAQTVPGQTAPPTPPPPGGEPAQPGQITEPGQLPADIPEPTGVQEKGPPNWSYGFGADEAYESDPKGTGQSGDSDSFTRIAGNVGRGWLLRRGSLGLSGSASQLFYRRQTDLNSFNYGMLPQWGFNNFGIPPMYNSPFLM